MSDEFEPVKNGDIVTIVRHPDRNKKYNILSGSALKFIAIVSMFIDHFGAVVIEYYIHNILRRQGPEYCKAKIYFTAPWLWREWMVDESALGKIDVVMRGMGRIAFPIFCFLLVEGFFYTKNVYKYGLRLLIFAVISELPYDLASYGMIRFIHQNVFFTLFCGLCSIYFIRMIENRTDQSMAKNRLARLVPMAVFSLIAWQLKSDYGAFGVLIISALYLLRSAPISQALTGIVGFFWELPAPLAFIPIMMYNGKRGLKLKYFFYIFYPAHLMLLFLFRYQIFGI